MVSGGGGAGKADARGGSANRHGLADVHDRRGASSGSGGSWRLPRQRWLPCRVGRVRRWLGAVGGSPAVDGRAAVGWRSAPHCCSSRWPASRRCCSVAGTTRQTSARSRRELSVTPSFTGDTAVEIPPLGSLHLRQPRRPGPPARSAWTRWTAPAPGADHRPDAIGPGQRTTRSTTSPGRDPAGAAGDRRRAARRDAARRARLPGRCAGSPACGGIALAVMVTSLAVGVTAHLPAGRRSQEPTYEGLLVNAPATSSVTRGRIADRYDAYRAQLQKHGAQRQPALRTVSDAAGLRATGHQHDPGAARLRPAPQPGRVVGGPYRRGPVRHRRRGRHRRHHRLGQRAGGRPTSRRSAGCGVPYVYVRGNHDSAVTAARGRRAAQRDRARQRRSHDGRRADRSPASATPGSPRTRAASRPRRATRSSQRRRGPSTRSGNALAATISGSGRSPVDIALVHDPASAGPLAGTCRWSWPGTGISARSAISRFLRDPGCAADAADWSRAPPAGPGCAAWRLMATHCRCSCRCSTSTTDRALQAYDDISVGGTGQTEVTLQRHIVRPLETAPPTAHPPSRHPAGASAGQAGDDQLADRLGVGLAAWWPS